MNKVMAITLVAVVAAVVTKKAKDSQENKSSWKAATDKI